MLLFALVLSLGLLLEGSTSVAAPCTLRQVKKSQGADLQVYFTKFRKEDQTQTKYRGCRIVTRDQAGTKRFYVTLFRHDANVVVHRSNWPAR